MRNTLSIAAAACAAALVAAPRPAAAQPAPSNVALFDTHAHMMVENITPDEEVALFKKYGVARILLMHPDPDALAEMVRKYPGYVIPSLNTARVNAKGLHLDETTGPLMTKLYNEHAVCAFGEITGAAFADNTAFRGLFAAAGDTGAPLILHIDLAKPETVALVEAAASANPKMNLVLAHLGWTAGPELIGRLLDAHPNIYTDVSIRFDAPGSLPWRNNGLDLSILTKDEQIPPDWLAVMKRHPDRFLFATDVNSFGPRYTILGDLVATARKALAPLPRPLQEAIGHGNAEKLLKGCGQRAP